MLFDVAILFPNSLRVALESWLTGIPHSVGYRGHWRRLLLNQTVREARKPGPPEHHSLRFLRIARECGAETSGIQDSTLINREQAPNARQPIKPGFENALDDDLNISGALGFLFETIRETNRAMDENKLDAASASACLDWWKRINTVLDLEAEVEIIVPPELEQLAKDREKARREKNWKRSDDLREQIFALGWEVRDTKDGPKLTRRASSG